MYILYCRCSRLEEQAFDFACSSLDLSICARCICFAAPGEEALRQLQPVHLVHGLVRRCPASNLFSLLPLRIVLDDSGRLPFSSCILRPLLVCSLRVRAPVERAPDFISLSLPVRVACALFIF